MNLLEKTKHIIYMHFHVQSLEVAYLFTFF